MKKTIFKTAITCFGIFFSFTALAQQQLSPAKESKVPGSQTQTENKVPAPASTTGKDLHETATKQSSFSGTAPVKGKDETQPAKDPEIQRQLPETSKLTAPNSIKNR